MHNDTLFLTNGAMIYPGTRRVFRLREVIPLDEVGKRAAQTFDIPLPHNSVGLPQFVQLHLVHGHAS